MLINSIPFIAFFAVVLLPYFAFFQRNYHWQNLLVLAASYFFYGWADKRMVLLLIGVTIAFYLIGIKIEDTKKSKKSSIYSFIGISLGVLLLFVFKYLNFMIDGFATLFSSFGLNVSRHTFNIVMPVGISFFTFKLISYVVEVKRGTISATRDFVTFATYVAFFPTIMAGPIDRPNTFIPQLIVPRRLEWGNISGGLKRILWGMFCKMCVADILCSYTDAVFDNLSEHSALSISFATILYTFQIYADFNGYSNMAIGVGQIMGIRVTENFMRPYLATSVSDFWRRWHMSLSYWIRDYIYIPLGGNRKGKIRMYINQLIAMTLCGLWHGANYTFVVWGFMHGLFVSFHKMWSQSFLKHDKHYAPQGIKRTLAIIFTFITVAYAWQFFRINHLSDYAIILQQFEKGPGSLFLMDPKVFSCGLMSVFIMIVKDVFDEKRVKLLKSTVLRCFAIACLVSYIILFGALDGKTFIYFQF